jgi:hypothetical protein
MRSSASAADAGVSGAEDVSGVQAPNPAVAKLRRRNIRVIRNSFQRNPREVSSDDRTLPLDLQKYLDVGF